MHPSDSLINVESGCNRMERKDLLEYLRYDADELFMSDLICRMSTYLSDEQIVDCLRPLAIQSLPPVNEDTLQTAIGAGEDDAFMTDDFSDLSGEDLMLSIADHVLYAFEGVRLLYIIGEDQYADRYLLDLASEMSSIKNSQGEVSKLLREMASTLRKCVQSGEGDSWFDIPPSDYVQRMDLSTATRGKTPKNTADPRKKKIHDMTLVLSELNDFMPIDGLEEEIARRVDGMPRDGILEYTVREKILNKVDYHDMVNESGVIAIEILADRIESECDDLDDLPDTAIAEDPRWPDLLLTEIRDGFEFI